MRPTALLLLAIALGACKRTPIEPEPLEDDWRYALDETLGARVQAAARTSAGRLWVALEDGTPEGALRAQFAVRNGDRGGFSFISRGDLPAGQITFLGAVEGSREWVFAHVHGKGFFRTWAGSGQWAPVELTSPALTLLSPRARPIPLDLAVSPEGVIWLASIGGLYYSSDEGATWTLADTSTSGNTNLVFTGVDAVGSRVVAVAALPESLIPGSFQGLISGRVFVSDNSGLTWSDGGAEFPSNHPTSVALADDGVIYVGTMDEGVVRFASGSGWAPLFGPTDVRDVAWARGGLDIASATRGAWRLQGELLSRAGGGQAVAVVGSTAVMGDGEVYQLEIGEPEPAPPPRDGQVHVALSFHVNYYHSYRGDANTEDGFGRDIRIIRRIQSWLDARPGVRADWDLDNAFSTDDWMQSYSPDILERIAARVADGRDDVRLMSWNNGAMASSTRDEFDESVTRAWDSNEDLFGRVVPGVQPQENMLSPDHLAWYRAKGVDWITLFYSANGFTGPRNDIELNGLAAFNPFQLVDPDTQGSMVGVPVYHHSDLLDHGGLRGWVRQLNAAYDEDTLLVIHFDADGDSWENFDLELDAIADLPFVRFTTINTYLDQHPTRATVPLPGDVADGVGDGFSSWAEKSINHEVWTTVERSRRLAAVAGILAPDDVLTQDAVAGTLEPRLLALSTTHFGLATPRLHPDREVAARYRANDALHASRQALAFAESTRPLSFFELEVVNPRDVSGVALIPFQLRLPTGIWEGEEGLWIDRSGAPQPHRAFFNRTDGDQDIIDVFLRMPTAGASVARLTWSYDPGEPRRTTGALTLADVPTLPLLQPPLAECGDRTAPASGGSMSSGVDPWGLRATRTEQWSLPTCDGVSNVRRDLFRIDQIPGVFVEVRATIANPADASGLESLALAPFTCPGGIDEITWPTYGGRVRSRPVPPGLETWNPVSADGWVSVLCRDGQRVQIAVDTSLSTTMGLLTLRNDGPDGLLAPLGTLWGDGAWHDAARNGGLGWGDHITPMVGSQFTPSAPSWAGQEVHFRLWITGADIESDWLDIISHPPYVRVPPLPVPTPLP